MPRPHHLPEAGRREHFQEFFLKIYKLSPAEVLPVIHGRWRNPHPSVGNNSIKINRLQHNKQLDFTLPDAHKRW
jgi:hypothetical protein